MDLWIAGRRQPLLQHARHGGDGHAVVGREGSRFAVGDRVVLGDAQKQEVARLHLAGGRRERLFERDRQPEKLPAHEASSPIDSSTENSASSMPVRASASFSDGPSVRSRTTRISGIASGSDNNASRTRGEMSRPKIATTG